MTDLWAVLSLATLALCVVVFAVLHIIAPDLSPVDRTLSEYALTVDGWLYPIAATGLALAPVFLSIRLRHGAPPVALGLLWLFGAAMLVAAGFRADPTGERSDPPATRAGLVHTTAGLVACLSASVAAPLLAGTLVRLGARPATAIVVSWLPAAGVAMFALTVLARGPLRTVTGRAALHGLGERAAFAAFAGWLGYAAVESLRLKH
jgi:hypothetical protein